MKYIDGYVLVVPKGKLSAYKRMARKAGRIWKKYGALEYIEAIGDELPVNMGGMKMLNFPKLARLNDEDTLWFSFIVFNSKSHRNQVNAKVMRDPQIKDGLQGEPMPFDMRRFSYGGFKVMVEERNA